MSKLRTGITNTGKALDALVEKTYATKQFVREKLGLEIDKWLALGALNGGILYGAAEVIDRTDFSDPTNGLIMFGTGVSAAAMNYGILSAHRISKGKLTRIERTRRKFRSLHRSTESNRFVSLTKTALLTGALFGSVGPYKGPVPALAPYAQTIIEDARGISARLPSRIHVDQLPSSAQKIPRLSYPTDVRLPEPQRLLAYREFYDALGYSPMVQDDLPAVFLAPKESTIGRMQRAIRYKPLYLVAQEKRGVPWQYLGGMAMQESYGDPLQLNRKQDSGAGLLHIQATVAKELGLKIHSEANGIIDHAHGKRLVDLVRECGYSLPCAAAKDDRMDLLIVLDAAGRIIQQGKALHGTWEHGVMHYRAPAKVDKQLTRDYLRKVQHWADALENPTLLAETERDFNDRNKTITWADYMKLSHDATQNWGTARYRALTPPR